MSYAVRKDGQGWRSVESVADCTADEYYSENQPNPVTPDLATIERTKRDALLLDSQWLVQRHRDQIEVSEPTTLTADQYKALLTYRQALRDVPTQTGFPDNIVWPSYPL
ncbi:phage tail assembly chaperone [Acinetobacter sp. ANC 4640]